MYTYSSAKTSKTSSKVLSPLTAILKGVLSALLISCILIVISAFLLQKQILGVESIRIINPIVKAASAMLAALVSVRRFENRSFIYGGITGISYMLVTWLVFSFFAGEFNFGTPTLIDLSMCLLAGTVGGIFHGLSK